MKDRPLKGSLSQLAPSGGQLASSHTTYTFLDNVLLLQGCQFINKIRKHAGFRLEILENEVPHKLPKTVTIKWLNPQRQAPSGNRMIQLYLLITHV